MARMVLAVADRGVDDLRRRRHGCFALAWWEGNLHFYLPVLDGGPVDFRSLGDGACQFLLLCDAAPEFLFFLRLKHARSDLRISSRSDFDVGGRELGLVEGLHVLGVNLPLRHTNPSSFELVVVEISLQKTPAASRRCPRR